MNGRALSPSPGGGTEGYQGWGKGIGLLLGPLLFVFALFLPLPGLSLQAHRLAAVLSLTITYWMTEAIPLPATALLAPALCVVLGVGEMKPVFSPFGDPIIFLFIGSFIIARAMSVHGLDRRFALVILSRKWVAGSPRRILLAFGAIAALLSLWVSNTAATAMLFPIGIGLLRAVEGEAVTLRPSRYATGMMLICAYGASVGGIGTLVGTPPNLIGQGMIRDLAGVNVSFFGWMTMAMPLVVVMFVVLYLLMALLHPPQVAKLESIAEYVEGQRASLGPWTAGQRATLGAFLFAVTLWVGPGVVALFWGASSHLAQVLEKRLPEGASALLAALLLLTVPTSFRERQPALTWREAVRIDWGTILLFGGGLSLGGLMFSTGLAKALGDFLTHATGAHTLWEITAASTALGILMSETTSNTASANMVIPVMIAVAKEAGVSPVAPALAACLGASYGFILPVSTPPNAIVYGTGLVPLPSMMRAGILFDLCGFAIITGGLRLLWPVLALSARAPLP